MTTMATTKADAGDSLLPTLVQWFEAAEDASRDERALAERDRDYYDGKQLTAAEEQALAKRKQPAIVVNRIKRKIDFLRGVETQQRTDPKAFPRTPHDEDAAQAATDALRYVADANSFDVIASDVWETLLIEGFAGCEVRVEQKAARPDPRATTALTLSAPRYDVVIEHLPWDRLFRDPHSRKPDCSDARYLGVVLWLDHDEAAQRWPDAKDDLGGLLDSASASDTYEDRPQHQIWVDGKRRRVRIVQMWHRKGRDWHFTTFTKGAVLETGVSPYTDEDGATECPLVLQSAYIDRDNRRYGVVREMIGPQDEINKRRSKALHLLNVRQVIAERGAVDDVQTARQELAKPDGYVEITPSLRFEIAPAGDLTSGHFQLLQEAKNEIDMMGPNASMQGKGPGDQSGRAIIAQQQGGYIELGPMSDRLKQWKIRVYRAAWNRVRQFWTEERWVRITDDERNVRFVGLNRPLTAREQALAEMQRQGMAPEEMQQVLADAQARGIDLEAVVGTENHVASLTVDIMVDDAPDAVTIQHEQFQQLTELARSGFPIPPDLIIEASQLRNKDKLLEVMKNKGPDPMQQQAAQLDLAQKQASIAKTAAEAKRAEADAMAKMQPTSPLSMPAADGAPPMDEPGDQIGQAQAIADVGLTRAKQMQIEAETLVTLQTIMRPELPATGPPTMPPI